jgi:hypothetical protein
MVSFFVAIPILVSDERPCPITRGTAFESSRGDITPVVVKAPVKVVALIVSLKITPVQSAPPIVKVPAVVVSIEFAVRAPHFIPPVKMLMLLVALPKIVTVLSALPIAIVPEPAVLPFPILTLWVELAPAAIDTAPDAVGPLAIFTAVTLASPFAKFSL